MKSLCRWSGLISFAAFLCLLPCAFGQNTANVKLTPAAHSVLNFTPSNFLAFALTSGDQLYYGDKDENGCDGDRDDKKNKCAAVPEGGTPLMYLLLAGFSCLGGIVLRSRRHPPIPVRN